MSNTNFSSCSRLGSVSNTVLLKTDGDTDQLSISILDSILSIREVTLFSSNSRLKKRESLAARPDAQPWRVVRHSKKVMHSIPIFFSTVKLYLLRHSWILAQSDRTSFLFMAQPGVGGFKVRLTAYARPSPQQFFALPQVRVLKRLQSHQ